MSNINMNKYDAAQTMNAGTSTKMSMDYQQTASNQSSVRTGTEISNKDIDENIHKGSTWITDSQTGKTYEVNGTFDQTSGGWTGSGNIREYDKNGNYIGQYEGKITGSGNMADYQKDVVQGGHGGRENAFQATSVVSTNLDASNVKTENTKYENMDTVNVGNSGSISGDNIMVNGEKVSGKVSWNGDTATIEGTKDGMKYSAIVENASIGFGKNGMSVTGDVVESSSTSGDTTTINTDNQIKVGDEVLNGGTITQKGDKAVIEGTTADGMKYTATVGNAEINKDENGNYTVGGQVAQSRKEGGNSVNVDNTTSISTGTQYKGVAQAAMGKTEDFEKMMTRLADMKQAVLNGDMSAKEFQAEVRNFSGAYAQEMGQFLTKQESEQQGTKAQANVGVQGDVSWDSGQTVYGKAAQAVTGLSASGGVGVDAGVGISRQDTTQSAQNLIAKEMYDTIMQSGNSTDMINNASNLANKHADTNLSDLENMKESFNEMTGKAKEMGAGAVESGKNMVKDIIK